MLTRRLKMLRRSFWKSLQSGVFREKKLSRRPPESTKNWRHISKWAHRELWITKTPLEMRRKPPGDPRRRPAFAPRRRPHASGRDAAYNIHENFCFRHPATARSPAGPAPVPSARTYPPIFFFPPHPPLHSLFAHHRYTRDALVTLDQKSAAGVLRRISHYSEQQIRSSRLTRFMIHVTNR